MTALAYVLLPVSGLVAYSMGTSARIRFHGAQAIAYGLTWPVALYVCSFVSAVATQGVFVAGTIGWVLLLGATALGRDPTLPFVGGYLRRVLRIE